MMTKLKHVDQNCMINEKILNKKMVDIWATHDKDLLG